ncbi:unnamed protein product [Hermetia illucens]|uniref:Uncharacterized protein n=1 Tax=Hermetia illucens TaxID=343691 RepID=A0A7R8YSQ7_HERIL|nr:unnamed protein product [Hermetia illucens]
MIHGLINVPISEPDIKFILLPSSNRIISPNNGAELLPCLVSIRNETVYSNSDFDSPFHIWLRNGEPIAPRKNEFQIFENGTLKIFPGDKAAGSYRCLVNGTEIEAGILLSNETIVQNAVFKRKQLPSEQSSTAIIGQPAILQCPIQSVPKANISWFFGNKNTNSNRFLILENGGLLIKNTTGSDKGKFKCVAKNKYAAKGHRQFTLSVSVQEASDESDKAKVGLLPRLQNDTIYVEAGKSLRLHCVSYSEDVDWSFIPRTQTNLSIPIRNHSLELLLEHVTFEDNDGWYRCATKSDSQVFNVIVTTPPAITIPLENWESSLAAQASFNCHATGNPPPTITWYRNGVRLENGLRIHYTSQALYIKSIDLDEGIYQCFAKNPFGEAFSSGRLVLRRKDELPNIPKRPENVTCYPVNFETVFVTFSGSSALSFITPHMVTRDPFNWKTIMPISLTSTSNFTLVHMPVFRPFILFLRGMVPTSTQKTINGEHHTFDSSLLSEGANCGTQGMRINTVFLQTGIFIFWTPMDAVKAKYFRIQFWNNNSKNALMFPDAIVGTTHPIDLQRTTKANINAWLFKMPVLNRTISANEEGVADEVRSRRSINGGGGTEGGKQNFKNIKKSEKHDKDFMDGGGAIITEVRVPGNVTGMLISNVQNIKVRVLIITEENENMFQDLRYVEWESIFSDQQPTVLSSNHEFLFRVSTVESRSITVSWNPIGSVSCIRVCYFINMLEAKIRQNNENTCHDIYELDVYLTIRKLLPSTVYHMNFLDCNSTHYFGMIETKTLPDAPGPITNQKIIKSDGFQIEWDPPINPNGKILHYNIKWTIRNKTHSANVTRDQSSFKFPNVTEDDRVNITIRAIGTSGVGLPIFMDTKYIIDSDCEKETSSFSDPLLGIIIGILLSICCILIFIWIFIKQRKRFKARGCGQGISASPTDSHCPQTPASNMELREMQTLIPKSPALQIIGDGRDTLPQNGIYYSENDEETEIADNLHDMTKAVYSSTPKATRRVGNSPLLSDRLLEEHGTMINNLTQTSVMDQIPPTVIVPTQTAVAIAPPTSIATAPNNTITNADHDPTAIATQLINKVSSSPNFCISKLQPNGNSTKLQNGSIKTTLPPNKHSMQAATTQPKLMKANGSLKNADSIQYSLDPNSNTSATLDNSRHKLLDTKLDSSSTISQLNDTKNHRNNNHRPPPPPPHHNQQPSFYRSFFEREPTKHNHLPQRTLDDSGGDTTVASIDLDDSSSIRNINSSSSSCNPLLKSSWNHRRPIVEPNG